MAFDPMPYGSGEFSFTMDTSLAYLWPPAPAPTPTPLAQDDTHYCHKHMESVAEMEEMLAGASSELRKTREDVRLKQHKIASLADLMRRNKHERDQLRQQIRNNPLLARHNQAMTPSGGGVSGRSPLPSPVAVHHAPMFNPFAGGRPSSSPVAVHRPAMVNPYAVPRPAAVIAHKGTSTATAIQMPSEDGSAVAAPQLQLPAAKSPLASSPPVSADRSALVNVPRSSASAAVVEEGNTATAAAQLAATRPLALGGRTALFQPSTLAHNAAVNEHLEMLAAKRPLPQKGSLVQAVMEAGPLLENLMVVEPVPRWRNPPPALATAMTSAPSTSGAQMGLPRWRNPPPALATAMTSAPSTSGAQMGLPRWRNPPPALATAMTSAPSTSGAQMGLPRWRNPPPALATAMTLAPSTSGAQMGLPRWRNPPPALATAMTSAPSTSGAQMGLP